MKLLLTLLLCLGMSSVAFAQGTAFVDDFSTGTLNARWNIDTGPSPAPGPNNTATFETANVDLTLGYLSLKLTQTNVGAAITSKGAEIRTTSSFGFGTYIARFRASSTATTIAGGGSEQSGSDNSPFIFINNSQTEIDWPEFEGQGSPGLAGCTSVGQVCAEWTNFVTDPSHGTNTNTVVADADQVVHEYKMIWTSTLISYYVDGALVTTHTTNIPTVPAPIFLSTFGTNSASFGGVATTGANSTRFMYVTYISYDPSTNPTPPPVPPQLNGITITCRNTPLNQGMLENPFEYKEPRLVYASFQGSSPIQITSSLQLNWTATPNADTYTVKRSLVHTGPYTTIGSGLQENGCIDNRVNPRTTYFYVVSATNEVGTSANSAEGSATTP